MKKSEEYFSGESVAHQCTIILLSAYPKIISDSTQTFNTINKLTMLEIQLITYLNQLLVLHISRLII